MFREVKESSWKLSMPLLLLAAVTLLLWGCGGGGGSFDTPTETSNEAVGGSATSVLIEAATLKTWIDEGLVGNETGFGDRVVVIDLGTADTRIQGACQVSLGELTATRFEGVGYALPMVATGAQMDALIQRLGIEEDTVIVFSAPGNIYAATRAYFTFRYWGFPIEQLKVLNGGNTVFEAEYPGLISDVVPTATASTYSVRNLSGINDDVRASMGEMIEILKGDLVDSTTDIIFDARGKDPVDGDSGYFGTGVTNGKLSDPAAPVVFDGHPAGGQYLNYSALLSADKTTFVSPDVALELAEGLESLFAAKGWTEDLMATVYCTSAYSATPLFFALDAIMGADVQLYDGSWSQFGNYSDYAVAGAQLPLGSPWAVDKYMDPATLNYNLFNASMAAPLVIETLNVGDTLEVLTEGDVATGFPNESIVPAQAAPFLLDPNPLYEFLDDPTSDSDVVQSKVEENDEIFAAGLENVAFTAPVLTATPNVLIEVETLQGWMALGLVNKEGTVIDPDPERVVILDVTALDADKNDNYSTAGHIPGAVHWNVAGQAMFRMEGPAPAINLVLNGASMDARLKASGIDNNTTIVITSTATNPTYYPNRAYFTLRYWGIPKERIKVLNGYNAAWPATQLTTVAPTITASTLNLADLIETVQVNTRVSLAELMDATRDGRGTAIDFRGDKSATGSTDGVYSDVAGDVGVFEGTINGGKYFAHAAVNEDGNKRFKSRGEIIAAMLENDINVADFSSDGTYSNPAYSYCRTGYIASTGFFVLDAILGVDAMVYDGSWSQWGKMSTVKGGELSAASPWATDTNTYMSVINYNVDNLKALDAFSPDADALQFAPADTNQIEDVDFDYQIQAPADSGSSSDGAPTSGSGDLGGNC